MREKLPEGTNHIELTETNFYGSEIFMKESLVVVSLEENHATLETEEAVIDFFEQGRLLSFQEGLTRAIHFFSTEQGGSENLGTIKGQGEVWSLISKRGKVRGLLFLNEATNNARFFQRFL